MNGMRKRAGKTLRKAGRKIAQKKKAVGSCVPRDRKDDFVIVGNYKEGQLAWIKKNGIYNYPVREGDEFNDDALRAVKELWLFANVKGDGEYGPLAAYLPKPLTQVPPKQLRVSELYIQMDFFKVFGSCSLAGVHLIDKG